MATTTSPYARMILITEKQYQSLNNSEKPLPRHKGPSQQYKLKSLRKRDERIKKENLRKQQKSEDNSDNEREYIDKITSNVKKTMLPKATSLFRHLKSKQPLISWNEFGEMKYSENIIAGSDLVELIKYATSNARQRATIPQGWQEFKDVLKVTKVPRSLLSKSTLQELDTQRQDEIYFPPLSHQSERQPTWIEM